MHDHLPRIPVREGLVDEVKAAIGDAFLSAKDEVGEISIDVERGFQPLAATSVGERRERRVLGITGRGRSHYRSIVPSRRIFRCSCRIP